MTQGPPYVHSDAQREAWLGAVALALKIREVLSDDCANATVVWLRLPFDSGARQRLARQGMELARLVLEAVGEEPSE